MIAPGLRVPEFWRRILVFNPSIDIKMVEGRETPRLILYDWNIKNKQTCHRSVVSNSVSSWTVADQAPLSMGFSRQEYWSGLPFSPPGDLPDPGIEPWSPALWADALPSKPPGKPQYVKKNVPYPLPRLSWILLLLSSSWWSSLYQPLQLSDYHLPFFCLSFKPSQLPGIPSPSCLLEL